MKNGRQDRIAETLPTTVFRPIEIVALPFPVYRFTLVMKFYH